MQTSNSVVRILHIVSDLTAASGVMSVVMNYYRFIDRSKIQFDFLYFEPQEEDHGKEIRALGGKIYKIGKPAISAGFLKEADRFFAQHEGEYRIVHCHPIFASEIFGWAAKRHGVQHVIQHSHSTKFSIHKKAALRNWCISLLGPLVITDYMACSDQAAVLLGKRVVKKNHYTVLNNAIHCSKYRFQEEKRKAVRKQYGIAEHTKVIGHTGRFAPEKNHVLLLHIFAEYHRLEPDSCLLLLGNGDGMAQIKELTEQLKLTDSVIFAGRKDHVQDYLCAMDIFLFPSVYEGLSLALVEAQCSGLYCFVSDTVAPETCISHCYESFSLEKKPEKIAKMVFQTYRPCDRYAEYENVSLGQLNIETEAKKLETFYLNLK
ncbi:MAG: glycosyltransferase [Clostridia bacterium]|nr:glycosyltransferase [Clostridia bacterium]